MAEFTMALYGDYILNDVAHCGLARNEFRFLWSPVPQQMAYNPSQSDESKHISWYAEER